MLDHDALSFSLVPFCYGVCPFVNQLHPLPSATSGIPESRVRPLVFKPYGVLGCIFDAIFRFYNMTYEAVLPEIGAKPT